MAQKDPPPKGPEEQDRDGNNVGGTAPRWAAVVGDTLVPMPRRRLAATDILFQASAPPSVTLVRDFNSPNDIGFTPSAMVDLAEGNVFRLASACAQQDTVRPDAE